VTEASVRQWIAEGRANAQTRIKRDGSAEWTTVGALPEFSAPPAPPAEMPLRVPVTPPGPGGAPDTTETVLAGRGERLLAQMIDGLAAGVCVLPAIAAAALSAARGPGNAPGPLALVAVGVSLLAVLALVGTQFYLLATRGQTIGKILMKIRIVVYNEGSNPGFVKVVLLRLFLNGLIGAVPFVGPVYSLVDICFIFRDDRRCIHDLIAGTEVVKV
jgi:uncharacterized RDD family membrane protein YckC